MIFVAIALLQWQDWYWPDRPVSLPASFLKPGAELVLTYKPLLNPTEDPYVPVATYEVKTREGLFKIMTLSDLEPFVQITTMTQAAEYSWWLTAYGNRQTFGKRLLSIIPAAYISRSQTYLPLPMWEFDPLEGGYLGSVSQEEWKALHFPEPQYERISDGNYRVVRPLMSPTGPYGSIEAVLVEEVIGSKGQYRVLNITPLETPSEAGVSWRLPTYR